MVKIRAASLENSHTGTSKKLIFRKITSCKSVDYRDKFDKIWVYRGAHTRHTIRYPPDPTRPTLPVIGMTHQTVQYTLLQGQFRLGLRRRG